MDCVEARSRFLHQIAGILHSSQALCAFSNPTVNSYKRINAAATASGATWSPNTASYGGNNRTHAIQIPDRDRFELPMGGCVLSEIKTTRMATLPSRNYALGVKSDLGLLAMVSRATNDCSC